MKWYGLFCDKNLIKVMYYGKGTAKPSCYDFGMPLCGDKDYYVKEVEISVKKQ